jgi:hypothetical protein
MDRDVSQVFAKVFKALKEEGVTRGAIARDLALTTAEVDSLLVGLAIASVSQPQQQQGIKPRSTRDKTPKPNLRVV